MWHIVERFSDLTVGHLLTTVKPLYCGHLGDLERCPHFRKHIWDTAKCPQYRGVLISGVSFKRGSTVLSRSSEAFYISCSSAETEHAVLSLTKHVLADVNAHPVVPCLCEDLSTQARATPNREGEERTLVLWGRAYSGTPLM